MIFQPFRASNDTLDDPIELRRRIENEGYLFLRKFQDPEKLRDLRLRILERIDSASDWMLPNTKLSEGKVDPTKACTEPDREYQDVYHEVYKLQPFHEIAHSPEVVSLIGKLVESQVFPHPHVIARLWFPNYSKHTTPFHQDFVHFQSNLQMITVWTPLSDCPIELGPLAIVEGSHRVGEVVDHHFSLGAGGQKVSVPESRGIPRCNDFELGDTLIFGCLMVHGALPNTTKDQLRISLDNRYTKKGLPISEHMLTPHLNNGRFTWENVYEGWPEDHKLRYFWKKEKFETIPQDVSFGQKAFEEALDLAGKGDEDAIYALQRVAKQPITIETDPRIRNNSEQAQRRLEEIQPN
ncbi:MAG: 1-deoxypentalenic acid 11-beta-hydroxylase [Candidatus Moanabacter tarae]|uniref:1-deoxypentalenic acid 11-beta-hydroxylase n=1 Tax=Candidatus Moanibacter tarae TaxID=2200854 RepID=A0A2Z4AET2_9BACT|nr:MAG: 1-deoxypentalenic acid 11-beta-hydroxylase [Candidatus Moanabacter tarae]|tara:strand:- start:61418 stop:62473 length:1056 start_codon:yes stop_codon:yes gene_type:complete